MLVLGSIFAAAAGCAHGNEGRPGTTTTTSASVEGEMLGSFQNEAAIGSVTDARCNREYACGRVGPGQHFATFVDCRTELDGDVRAALSPSKCSRSIDDSAVSHCLSEIRDQKCDNTLDSVGNISSCRSSEVCK